MMTEDMKIKNETWLKKVSNGHLKQMMILASDISMEFPMIYQKA